MKERKNKNKGAEIKEKKKRNDKEVTSKFTFTAIQQQFKYKIISYSMMTALFTFTL